MALGIKIEAIVNDYLMPRIMKPLKIMKILSLDLFPVKSLKVVSTCR
jgi:hypothetical protein